MKNRTFILGLRRAHVPRRDSGFTLIELLTVMAIIVALAGLVLGSAGLIQTKAATAKAKAEIANMTTAINSYQTDNGSFPRSTNNTDKLDPRTSFDPGKVAGGGAYQTCSMELYLLLSGNGFIDYNGNVASWAPGNASFPDRPKTYIEFKTNQLQLKGGATVTNGRVIDPVNNVLYIIDPWGQSYGYSTVYVATSEANAAKTPPVTDPITKGFNPTFDLWSTAGYGGGKPYPTNVADKDKPNLWISNWNGNSQ